MLEERLPWPAQEGLKSLQRSCQGRQGTDHTWTPTLCLMKKSLRYSQVRSKVPISRLSPLTYRRYKYNVQSVKVFLKGEKNTYVQAQTNTLGHC